MIDYSEDWLILLVFKTKGSVMLRASYFAIPAAILAFILVCIDDWVPEFRSDYGFDDASKSQLWSATTGVLAIMLGFRTNRAMSRFWEGTGLLHQMRGEWFDSVSCCVTFSRGSVEAKPWEVLYFRHTIVRLMSLCHGSALEEIADSAESGGSITTIDSFGLDSDTLRHLKQCKEKHGFNRVEVLLHLTQSIITKALDDGILKIPPPILSRVYQTLSRGFVNLLNAKKIADTRFPFPYAQIITMLLIGHTVLTPIMLSCLMSHKVMCPLFTFVPIFGMFYLNFVGVELENPFGDDENDLPLDHFQSEMNNCLLMLLQENADLIATIDPNRCTMNFNILKESLKEGHNDGDIPAAHAEINHRRISQFDWGWEPEALDSEDGDFGSVKLKETGDHATISMSLKMANAALSKKPPDDILEGKSKFLVLPGPTPLKEEKETGEQAFGALNSAVALGSLDSAMFTGAVESFLDARPVVLDPMTGPWRPLPSLQSEQGFAPVGSEKKKLVHPLNENPQRLSAPIFAPALPYGATESPRQYATSPRGQSEVHQVQQTMPQRTLAVFPNKNFGSVPKITQLQQIDSKRTSTYMPLTPKELAAVPSLQEPSGAKGNPDRGHMRGGSAASMSKPKPLDQGVEQSMGDFKVALDNWTQLIEGQLTELRQNVAALRRFSDTIPELIDVGRKA